jgi:transposase
MRTITLSPQQQHDVEILARLEAGTLDAASAAELLGVSVRQVRRLRASYRAEGMAAVVHGNQGRAPANRTDPAVVERIVQLAGPGGKYHDLNTCHLQELLAREEQIAIGRSTLDRLLKQAGVRKAAPATAPVHRRRRERRSAEGMLLQIDGSPFTWLEGRAAKATLIGAIDDATGKILFLFFRPTEDQVGYLWLLHSIAQRYGLPMSIYHDRHTILRSPKQATLDEQLAGQSPMSQLQRVMAELGIESIAAYSPQAKGRIERLWSTLQDRLTKELRLADSTTLDDANAFLPGFIERYNARFGRPPADPESAWVPLPADLDFNYYFAIRETRVVRADYCIRFDGQLLQIRPGPDDRSLAAQRISVHVGPAGDIHLYDGKRRLTYQRVAAPPPQPTAPASRVATVASMPEPTPPPQPAAPKRTAAQRRWLFGQH